MNEFLRNQMPYVEKHMGGIITENLGHRPDPFTLVKSPGAALQDTLRRKDAYLLPNRP